MQHFNIFALCTISWFHLICIIFCVFYWNCCHLNYLAVNLDQIFTVFFSFLKNKYQVHPTCVLISLLSNFFKTLSFFLLYLVFFKELDLEKVSTYVNYTQYPLYKSPTRHNNLHKYSIYIANAHWVLSHRHT